VGKLFGTDGIRGKANEYPMTSEMALYVGRSVAYLSKLSGKGKENNTKIVIGKDTRISGDMIESALVSGICSMGVDVYIAGVLPTPGIAFITSSMGADAGIVISASHNPYFDNGIKIFKHDGFKPSDEMEARIEKIVLDDKIGSMCESVQDTGKVYIIEDAENNYLNFLKNTFLEHTTDEVINLKGFKIVLDCANGATHKVAPKLFSSLGVDVESLFINPDGKNINKDCGSQHPETLSKKVVKNGADLGLAFDGDGDRLIVVDENGAIATGDQILAVCAKHMKQKGELKNNTLVSTVMSNIGLGRSLKESGIDHVMSKVGDRHVMEEMIKRDAIIGGEDSGHMIFLNHHTTGDGILAGLRLIEAIIGEAKPLSQILKTMKVFPQELINVAVKEKPDIKTVPEIAKVIDVVEKKLGDKGRVLVRYSGTQPMCRVMVEGPSADDTRGYCSQIAEVIENKLN
jgi:phosphoglucosamine mutase